MVDFSKAIEELNYYKGSEKKKTLIYNHKKYLVKFPDPVREKNKKISYINNAFSEYIGSNIFSLVGFKTQNTLLGTYYYNEKEKIVCACEDFTDENHVLYEFESLALSANPDKKVETELEDIMEVIESITELKKVNITIADNIKEKFWDMFIVDSLIGNTDRHNGNWGLLVNRKNGKAEFAPIYDCGSCLNPMLDDKEIEKLTEVEIKNLAMNCYSCIKQKGKKINYMTYIKNLNNEECNKAIERIFPKIDLDAIEKWIDGITCMSAIRREFYQKLISLRYEILKDTYKIENHKKGE